MPNEKVKPSSRSIINLSHKEAKAFFLKHKSYSPFELPPYFQFDNLLNKVAQELNEKSLKSQCCGKPRELERVNHTILNNKDGRYAWRPYELIHPALYVSLVYEMTKKASWKKICDSFDRFSSDSRIKCLSIPVESLTDESDKAEQISQWWQEVEQKSLELSLAYDYVVNTDIVDCYAAIYTHSIAWALHTRKEAKKRRWDMSLIGNIIDSYIRDMRFGQTNGIPQGSILMDFNSEIVLGYADSLLAKKIKKDDSNVNDFQILRFRDDYRIFVNNSHDGEVILRCLTEVMIAMGLRLKPEKTRASNQVIRSSIKGDKLDWMFRKNRETNFQRHLLIIHNHSTNHPNGGSVNRALYNFYKRLVKDEIFDNPLPLISMAVDIARHNPRTYPITAAILSKLVNCLAKESQKRETIEKIRRKFSTFPNTGHIEIWLQRISYRFDKDIDYDEPLCRLVRGEDVRIWNNNWISSEKLSKIISPEEIISRKELRRVRPVIPLKEVRLFDSSYPG